MKRTSTENHVLAILASVLLSGCGIAQVGEPLPGEQTATVWNMPYSASEEHRRGVFMYYVDGKPVSYTYKAVSLPAGSHDIEVQCFICETLGYAIDQHTIKVDAKPGHQYQFRTRMLKDNRCDAWLVETAEILH